MNLRYQETFCIIFLLCTSITLGEDFDFVSEANDDVEPISAEPLNVDSQAKINNPKAGFGSLPTTSTIQLSLILRSKSWKHVQTSLKQRTISKLAEYFLVPEDSFIVEDVNSHDRHTMLENALKYEKKPPLAGKSLGLIGFPIEHGEKMSRSAWQKVRNINKQLAEIRDITGMDFGWWIIWKSGPTEEWSADGQKNLARQKREVELDDDYTYDYDDDDVADDDEGETTEVPHARRHHHGSSEYSTKSVHSSPTHATTNKHTNNDGHDGSEKHHHHHHQQHQQQQHHTHHTNDGKVVMEHGGGRGGTSEHRKSPVMVSVTSPATTQTSPKRKHTHGLYDQVKERSAKKQAAAAAAAAHTHNHQPPEQSANPATEATQAGGGSFATPPDLRESVSQLESTISKTIANNEQLKKDEETLLARKSKHKRIDIERIVETELLLPEIERLQDEVFRDDYVIEDVVRGSKFYDASTEPQLDGVGKFVPLEPQVDAGKQLTSTSAASVNRATVRVTTVKPVAAVTVRDVTTASPITTTSKSVPALTTTTTEGTTQEAFLTSTVPRRQPNEAAQSYLTTKLPHPAITPVVSSIDADEDAPSRSDTTTTAIGTTTVAPVPARKPPGPTVTSSIFPRNEEQPVTKSSPTMAIATTPVFTGTKMVATDSVDLPTLPVTTITASTTTTTTTITEGTTNSVASSASATNTRSTNIVASVPLVKSDDEATTRKTAVVDVTVKTLTTPTATTVAPIEYPPPSTTTASSPAITSTLASLPSVEMDVDEDSFEAQHQYVDEVDAKSSTFVSPELPPSTTTGSSFAGEDVGSRFVAYTITTISNVPLTTARQQQDANRYEPHNRRPFGRKMDEEYNSEDEEEHEEEEDIEEDEEDYFTQGPTTTQRSVSTVTKPTLGNAEAEKEIEYENYDDEYDDEEEEGVVEITTISAQSVPRASVTTTTTEQTAPSSTEPSTTPTTVALTTTTTSTTTTTTTTTTEAPTTTPSTTTTTTTTTETPMTTSTMLTTELDEPTNLPPTIRNRIPKQAIPAGKVFRYPVSLETFYDNEDGNNLRLELLDARDQPLKPNSWIQFNEDTKEIYGLPLEKDVSRWSYKLRATDSGNLTVTEKVDLQVQQHKSHRSLNHEISLALRLNRKFASNVDWHIETARGIAVVLGDVTPSNIIVRDIRNSIQDPSLATFVYTNETLPKDRCPEEKLDELVALLTEQALNDALNPDITVKSVQGQQIAQCTKPTIPKAKPTQSISRNFAPQTRNQVDQVNATVGHLLVFKVPADTFYDPEDGSDLKMKLLTTERHALDSYHWLQFDSKNQEFYGVPRNTDIGRKEYLLMAEDREGLTATDALVVVVNSHHKRDYSVLFELTLDITQEQFITAQVQRRFIERLAQVFGDASTHYIKVHTIRPIHHTGQVQVSFFNTTLNRQQPRCPQEEIEALRNILLHQDSTIRAKVREILGQEFSLQNVSLVPLDNCHGFDTPHHATSEPEKAAPKPISKDDYLLTFVLPSVIIMVMLLIAAIIACILYKRRLTGKMELEYINFKPIASSSSNPQGTDEERKSFRSKGIPVIFQDELDEKPEIGNKSPVILKDEKPPLLPPSYSSTNNDGENEDVDEYVPPQPVIVGGRESRGKSPVTPSYRRPPPYVSP
ncbi:uncharacterized protein LOC128301435 [Anopheles moucheti]|uniref:uncharacterized protein LOC128301435 n=1 Tax=Anopheles moucheti TaxID=186751 RepID=UPI0022F00FED|nr:uncharacterized protein LOC128301435 [Anopheles moucheti]